MSLEGSALNEMSLSNNHPRGLGKKSQKDCESQRCGSLQVQYAFQTQQKWCTYELRDWDIMDKCFKGSA